jgi:hypothetical protein
MAVFYGCAALLIFALIALTKSSNVAPNEVANRQTRSAGFLAN